MASQQKPNLKGGNGGANTPPQPSPWLYPGREHKPDNNASFVSFVEFLRWMRAPDSEYKDPTKIQILQMAEEKSKSYKDWLKQLNERTRKIAGEGNCFQAKCSWRIRVGGHRGPESILLPAFDALGMPFIPSSSLRGVARTQAIKEIMRKQKIDWKQAEKQIAPWFGSLEANNPKDRAGKVVFFDAYPISSAAPMLAVDMANNIWKWQGNSLEYKPNPNAFLSLTEPNFLIGLRLASGCTDTAILDQVKKWLQDGLQSGIGSQVNSGYGGFLIAGAGVPSDEFLRLNFSLKGQLIHGRQKFNNSSQPFQKDEYGTLKTDYKGNFKTDTISDAEVRAVAFKSMLRYWFRVLALGVLSVQQVQEWEATLFGGINPKKHGWIKVNLTDGKITKEEPRGTYHGKNDACGEQKGTLLLSYSSEAPAASQENLAELFKNLTWLMFHLGGIGQGARRPCYSRQTRSNAPWWRGSTLTPDRDNEFWQLPATVKEFQTIFKQRLEGFYAKLASISGKKVNSRQPLIFGRVSTDKWSEVVDSNCKIVVCAGNEDFGKPYALAELHSKDLKIEDRNGQKQYDGNLCGKVAGGVKPSPVWIANLGNYQVVTVFGSTQNPPNPQNPRKRYLDALRTNTNSNDFAQIWPLT